MRSDKHLKRPHRYQLIKPVVLCVCVICCFSTALLYSLLQSSYRNPAELSRNEPPPPPIPPPASKSLDARRFVWWHAPFLSGGGMGMEALQYVLGLDSHTNWAGRVAISLHGDVVLREVFDGLPSATQRQVARMLAAGDRAIEDARHAIIVCHSEPGAWALPEPLYQTSLCPPIPLRQAAFVVARAMGETDRVSPMHASRMNQMSEVWVPTEFHRRVFAKSGVNASKLVVIPEPVDTDLFNPLTHLPLPLPLGQHVFGPAWPHTSAVGAVLEEPYVFLSIFKWEARKGWDVLLRAFLPAFTADNNVLLLLSTKPFHSDSNFVEKMEEWVRREMGEEDFARLPSVYVLDGHIPQHSWPRLYKTADCFVLPTRGEGWGLPTVEAMAMELPTICTNWSGPTAYLDETVGYPLKVSLLMEVQEGAVKGHRWAQASVNHLVQLLRHVTTHRQEAAARGRAARQRMISNYSPAVVAATVAQHLRRIDAQLVDHASVPGR